MPSRNLSKHAITWLLCFKRFPMRITIPLSMFYPLSNGFFND